MVAERLNLQFEQTKINNVIIAINNKNVIITKLRHIENPGIVRTVYSGIFRHTEGHSAIFSQVQLFFLFLRQTKITLFIYLQIKQQGE